MKYVHMQRLVFRQNRAMDSKWNFLHSANQEIVINRPIRLTIKVAEFVRLVENLLKVHPMDLV